MKTKLDDLELISTNLGDAILGRYKVIPKSTKGVYGKILKHFLAGTVPQLKRYYDYTTDDIRAIKVAIKKHPDSIYALIANDRNNQAINDYFNYSIGTLQQQVANTGNQLILNQDLRGTIGNKPIKLTVIADFDHYDVTIINMNMGNKHIGSVFTYGLDKIIKVTNFNKSNISDSNIQVLAKMVVANKLVLAEIAKSVKLRRYDDAKRIMLKQAKLEPTIDFRSKHNGFVGYFMVNDKVLTYKIDAYKNDDTDENLYGDIYIKLSENNETSIYFEYIKYNNEFKFELDTDDDIEVIEFNKLVNLNQLKLTEVLKSMVENCNDNFFIY